MKKTSIILAIIVVLMLGVLSTAAEACGTNTAYSVYKWDSVGGPIMAPVIATGAEYIGVYFNANHVISLIQQHPDVSGFVVATDRTCGGYSFFQYADGRWWAV